VSEVRVEADHNVQNWYLAEFPLGTSTVPFYKGVEVRQAQGAHDIAVIPIEGIVSNLDRSYASGAPVRLTWGNRYGQNIFVGYVNHTKQDLQITHPRTYVVCLGASYPLLEVRQRAFEQVSADLVASVLARNQGLGAQVDAHPRTYPVMLQDTISDWALLQRLAAETGYVLRMEGTTLQFVSRARMEAYYKPRAQVYFQNRSAVANLQGLNTIISFTPVVGDYLPQVGATNTTKTITQVDPVTGMTILTAQAPSGAASSRAFFTSPQSTTSHTLQEASSNLEAATQASKYVYRAKATLRGSALTAPERFVYLKGVPAPYGGYWTVLSVTHRVAGKFNYYCDVELGTDGLYGEVPLPTAGLSSEMQGASILSGQTAFADLSVPESVLNIKTDVVGQMGIALQAARWTSNVVTYS
jgi:phage protein D